MTLPLVRNTGDMSAASNSRASAPRSITSRCAAMVRSWAEDCADWKPAERLIRSQPDSSSPPAPAPSDAISRRRVIRSIMASPSAGDSGR